MKLHFIDGDENKTIIADVGDNLLDLAHKNGVDLEGKLRDGPHLLSR